MVARSRSRQKVRAQGSTWLNKRPNDKTYQSYVETYQSTNDVWKKLKRPDGSLPPSHFESIRTFSRPILFSRNYTGGAWIYNFDGRPCTTGPTVPGTQGYPPVTSTARQQENQILASELIARTHPFAPVYSVPVAIRELAEVASLFHFAAKTFAGFAGNTYLNYRFGWLSFYRDVQTLLSITKEIEARAKDFNYLVKHGHTRKKLRLGSDTGKTGGPNYTHHSAFGVQITGPYTTRWRLQKWGSVTWSLQDGSLLPLDELSQFNRAVSVVFDLEEMDAPTLWELIPFSWLVDYFYNIGTALQSRHMQYKIQPYDVCIMRHYIHDARAEVAGKPSNVVINRSGFFTREIKTRDFVIPSLQPSLSFDLLRADRWKVLLALAAKFRG